MKMPRQKLRLVAKTQLFPLFIFLLPLLSWGKVQDNQFIYTQVQTGLFAPKDEKQSIQFPFALGAGYRSPSHWIFGVFFLYSSQDLAVIKTNVAAQNYLFGAEVFRTLGFGMSEFTGFQFGLKAGLFYRVLSATNSLLDVPIVESDKALDFVVGPRIGYEHTFSSGIAVGVEANVMIGFSSLVPLPMNVLGTARIWF